MIYNEIVNRVHTPECRPLLGLAQARLGLWRSLRYGPMPKTYDPELEKAVDKLLDIVADNVRRLVGARTVARLARESGVSKASVQRILGGSRGYANQKKSATQIDTLLRLAWYFDVPFVSLFSRRDRSATVLSQYPDEAEEFPGHELERRRRRSPPQRA